MEASVTCHSPPDTKEFVHRQLDSGELPTEAESSMMATKSPPPSRLELANPPMVESSGTTSCKTRVAQSPTGSPVNSVAGANPDDVNNRRISGSGGGPPVKPKKSPVSPPSGSSRRSLVEERAKRFSQQADTTSASPSQSKTTPDSAATQPWRKASSSPRSRNSDEIIANASPGRSAGDNPVRSPTGSERDNSSGSKPSAPSSSSVSQTVICQAAPPAEVIEMPVMPVQPTALSMVFETALLSQSARVEPSPERIFTMPDACEDVIKPAEVAPVDRVPPTHNTEAHCCKIAPKKNLKAFFGDTNIPVDEEHSGNADSPMDWSSESTETRKPKPETRNTGRKPPKMAAVSQIVVASSVQSPGQRPKKTANEREPSSSPKQKDHKVPPAAATASPPTQASKDRSAVFTSSGQPPSQTAWRNPFKRHGSGSTLSAVDQPAAGVKAVFGVPLSSCQMSATHRLVPLIVELCARIVEEKGLENQGIYRVSGNSGSINMMIDELNKDPVNLCPDNEKWQDVNVASGLLKLFFRKLPDSLMTDELYTNAIKVNQVENSERRMLKLKKLLHDLPEVNFETFRFLARHLSKVASKEEINKMDARNLAIMFGPSLIRPQEDTMVAMVRDMSDQCRIVESIILHCEWFFSSWDEDVNVPVDEEPEEATPISGMNQIMLAKAESLVAAAALLTPPSRREPKAAILAAIKDAASRHVLKKVSSGGVGLSSASGAGKSSNGHRGSNSSNRSVENLLLEHQFSESPCTSGAVFESDTVPDVVAEAVEEAVSFEIKKAYHFNENNVFYGVENTQSTIRRTRSNDSLLSGTRHRVVRRDPAPVVQGHESPLSSSSSQDHVFLMQSYPPPPLVPYTGRSDDTDDSTADVFYKRPQFGLDYEL